MMGMLEKLERAQLGVKLENLWSGALMYADDIVLSQTLDGAADYVESGSSVYDEVEDEVQQ